MSGSSNMIVFPTSCSKPISTRETFTPLISRSTCHADDTSAGECTEADCSSIEQDSATGVPRMTSCSSSECDCEQIVWKTITPDGTRITLSHSGKPHCTSVCLHSSHKAQNFTTQLNTCLLLPRLFLFLFPSRFFIALFLLCHYAMYCSTVTIILVIGLGSILRTML